ncbi:hypothetical protein D3C72_992070 [compost metagenome]
MLQFGLDRGFLRLDPALHVELARFDLQLGDGAGQVARFVLVVSMRNHAVELAGGQRIDRLAQAVDRAPDRDADPPGA